MSRKVGGKGLVSIEDSVDVTIQGLKEYTKKNKERWITVASNSNGNIRSTEKQPKIENINKKRNNCIDTSSNKTHKITWLWVRKGNLKRKTETLLKVAQNNVIRTNYIEVKIDNMQQKSKCWLCGNRDETVNHTINEYSKLSQKEDKIRHNQMRKVIYWELYEWLRFDHATKCTNQNPSKKMTWNSMGLWDISGPPNPSEKARSRVN